MSGQPLSMATDHRGNGRSHWHTFQVDRLRPGQSAFARLRTNYNPAFDLTPALRARDSADDPERLEYALHSAAVKLKDARTRSASVTNEHAHHVPAPWARAKQGVVKQISDRNKPFAFELLLCAREQLAIES